MNLANKKIVQLYSLMTKHYLRIKKTGPNQYSILADASNSSPDTYFLIHRYDANKIKFQSTKYSEYWIQYEGKEINPYGSAGLSCEFNIKFFDKEVFSICPIQQYDVAVIVDKDGQLTIGQMKEGSQQILFKVK